MRRETKINYIYVFSPRSLLDHFEEMAIAHGEIFFLIQSMTRISINASEIIGWADVFFEIKEKSLTFIMSAAHWIQETIDN